MPTVHDVPDHLLLKRLAEQMRRVPQVSPTPWADLVKSGAHTERPPQDPDWWFTRCASLLRKIYLHGPVGVSELRSDYGGRVRRGYRPATHGEAGGAIVRRALRQLEEAGLVAKVPKKGRILTSKGWSLMDRVSNEIFQELKKEVPALARYG